MKKLITACLFMLVIHNSLLADSGENYIKEMKRPLGFEENKGQFTGADHNAADYVLYKVSTPGVNIWITQSGISYQFLKVTKDPGFDGPYVIKAHTQTESDLMHTKAEWYRVDMNLKGASIKKENVVAKDDITIGKINYYRNVCPNGVFDVRTFSGVTIREVYPGIDWELYSEKGSLKQNFIVHPGADPSLIRLVYEGNGSFSSTDNSIHIQTAFGELNEGALFCYLQNETREISSSYNVSQNSLMSYAGAGIAGVVNGTVRTNAEIFSYEVSIQTGNYDRSKTLIIDPALVWGTFYGGADSDQSRSIAVDKGGNVFISGESFNFGFPTVPWGSAYYQVFFGYGLSDCFFMCFSNGGALNWATYYGGAETDWANGIVCDKNNHVYTTGTTVLEAGMTASTFPLQVLAGAYNDTIPTLNYTNQFLIRFNVNTGVREWATIIADGEGRALTVDPGGNLYVTGSGNVDPGQIRSGSYNDTTFAGGFDVTLLRFSTTGQLTWATNYGGPNYEEGIDVTRDEAGNVYIVGSSTDSFPIYNRPGAMNDSSYIGAWGSGQLVRFDANGVLTWSTYFKGAEQLTNVVCDAAGNVFVAGYGDTTNNGSIGMVNKPGAYNQPSYGGGMYDAIFAEFDPAGVLAWSTYYGGDGQELCGNFSCGSEMTVDDCGNLDASITSLSFNPTTIYTYTDCGQYSYSGTPMGAKIVMLKFTVDQQVSWSTPFGGNGSAAGWGALVALDQDDNLFITKPVYEPTFGWSFPNPGGGAFIDSVPSFMEDFYVGKFSPIVPILSQVQVDDSSCACGSATVTVTCGEPNYSYAWSNGQVITNTASRSDSITGLSAGNYSVTVTSSCGQTATATFTINSAPVGVNENSASRQLEVSPNPSSNSVNILIPKNKNEHFTFTLTDKTGRLILQTEVEAGQSSLNINLENYQSGVYTARLVGEKGALTGRVVKTN